MPFRLTYRGPLHTDSSTRAAQEKHDLRMHFHTQISQLWTREPLLSHAHRYLNCDGSAPGRAIYRMGGVAYACVVTERLSLHCELDILFLRPSPPGSLIRTGGDIDNRLKTLFDGLRRPQQASEVPPGSTFESEPIHCLLSDDALITKVSITTDQLLEVGSEENHVQLVIGVTVVAHDVTRDNIGYLK